MLLNVRNLGSDKVKSSELSALLAKHDIIALTETHLSSFQAHDTRLAGYKHFFVTRSERKGGGVSLLIKDALARHVSVVRECTAVMGNEI